MSLVDHNGNEISVGAPNVESYQWVPKEMVIMITSKEVRITYAKRQWKMTHPQFETFKKQLQGKWDEEAKRGGEKSEEQEAEEGIEASQEQCEGSAPSKTHEFGAQNSGLL